MEEFDNKSAREDQAWFEALSGKSDAGEGARLRRMLREIELSDAAREDTAHDWQRLQFALRREAKGQRNSASQNFRYAALAASVLIVVGTVSMLMPSGESPSQSSSEKAAVMRGISEQVLFSAAPSWEAKQLEAELLHLGVKVVLQPSKEKVGLVVSLSYPVSDEVRAVLESRIIPVPEQGDLRIIFLSTTE